LNFIEGDFLNNWIKKASANRHGHIYGKLEIANMWAIKHKVTNPRFEKCVDKISDLIKGNVSEKPICQPKTRVDLAVSDQERYDKANVGLLFHGTRSVNVTGILRTGLKLPKELVGVAITGAMFGPGAYFADDWKKSDGYTSRSGGYWSNGSGGVKGRKAFMFITNVILGKPFVAPHTKGYTSPPSGHNCVFGKAGVSGVQNNEWIIYDVSQHDMTYLIEYDVK
jgi:hypothetical protein